MGKGNEHEQTPTTEESKQELLATIEAIPADKIGIWDSVVSKEGGTIVVFHVDPGGQPHRHPHQ